MERPEKTLNPFSRRSVPLSRVVLRRGISVACKIPLLEKTENFVDFLPAQLQEWMEMDQKKWIRLWSNVLSRCLRKMKLSVV